MGLLLVCDIVILSLMAFFCGHFGVGNFAASVVNREATVGAGSVWDIATSTGAAILDFATFNYNSTGPIFLSLVFWFLVLILGICVVYLVRGGGN